MCRFGNRRELSPVLFLWNSAMRRITRASFDAEQFVENELQVDITGPAITLVQRQRNTISPIDLHKQPRVEIAEDVSAEDARVLHRGIQIALTRSAPADNEIHTIQMQ